MIITTVFTIIVLAYSVAETIGIDSTADYLADSEDSFDAMINDQEGLDDFQTLIDGEELPVSDELEVLIAENQTRSTEQIYQHILKLLNVDQHISIVDNLLNQSTDHSNKPSEVVSDIKLLENGEEEYHKYMNYSIAPVYIGVDSVQGGYVSAEEYHQLLKQVLQDPSRVDDTDSWYLQTGDEDIDDQVITNYNHINDSQNIEINSTDVYIDNKDGEHFQNDKPAIEHVSDEDVDDNGYQSDRRKGRRTKANVTVFDYRNEDGDEAGNDGVTLAIVFDGTGSMWDDLVQVKYGAHLIMEAMLERIDKPIKNYVLVPFHDPEIGPLTVTTDHAKFRASLQHIAVQGGGDCPEMSVGAVKMALEASLPNSFIYVFTDASAKDFRLLDDVLKLVQKKRSQIVFVLTGDCGEKGKIGYQVYEKIAATSSGQVFNLNKTNVKEVLNFVRASLQSRRVNLLSLNTPHASTDELDIVVDTSLREFTVSVSGENATINVTDPAGKVVDRAPQLQSLLSLDNVKVVNVLDPDPGKWTVTVHSDSEHSVRSSGKSDFDFKHGFALSETDMMEETNHRPLKGAKNTVLVQATDMASVANLTHFQIVDYNTAEVSQSAPLREVPAMPGLYRGGPFVPSNDFFYLGVEGFGKDGAPVKRITATAIQSQRTEPPVIHMRSKQSSWIQGPTILKCHVESMVPFTATWFKDGKPVSQNKQYKQTTDVLWLLKVTNEDSRGNYTCQADNMAGTASMFTLLSITGPPPVVTTSTSVSAVPKGAAVMSCDVTSELKHTLSWAQVTIDVVNPSSGKEILIPLQDNFRTKILKNGTLILHYANVADEGWYACIAESKGGKAESRVRLSLRDPLSVKVAPQRFEFQYGSAFTLTCSSSGTPAPALSWRKAGVSIQDDGRRVLVTQDGGLDLRVIFANNDDEGEYQCVADNEVESGEATAVGAYVEAPTALAEEGYKLAKSGDNVTIKCVIKGVPAPLITWLKDSEEIEANHSRYQVVPGGALNILVAQASDGGEYTCLAENQLGRQSDVIFVDVGAAPQLIQHIGDVSVDVGDDVSLSCLTVGFPLPHTSWRRQDGQELRMKNVATTAGDLLLANVTVEEGGVYVCTAENVFGEVEAEVNVSITGIVKPVLDPLSRPLSETTATLGQRLSLPCRVVLGTPPPTTSWYRDGELLDAAQMTADGLALDADALVIGRVAHQHRGSYECVVNNAGGSASQSTAVNVIEAPRFPDNERMVYKVHELSAVIIPCDADGHPKPLVTWEKDRMPLLPSLTVYKSPEDNGLVIAEASIDDTGTYTCTAVNAAGRKSRTTVLLVQVPPMIDDTPELLNVVDGSLVTMYCRVRAVPAARITWYRDEILVTSYRDNVELVDNGEGIRFVANMSDTGMYKCLAANEAGSDSRDILLVVLVSPNIHPPHDEHHTAAVGENVTLDCHVSGFPFPNVIWQRNGVHLGEVIADERVAMDEAGDFGTRVKRQDEDGDDNDVERVAAGNSDKRVKTQNDDEEEDDEVVADERLTMTVDGKLIVRGVRPEDAGFYICDAENEAGISQKIFYLQIAVPPRIVDDLPTTVKLMEGEDYSVPCTAVGSPAPEISWRRDGKSLVGFSGEDAIVLEDGTLVVINASELTTGVYTCYADNAEGGDKKNYIVQVMVAPSMTDSGEARNLDVVEGDDLVVSCPAIDAVPAPNIQWLKNDRPLESMWRPDGRYSLSDGGRLLTLRDAAVSDAGNYSCLATNLAGHTTAAFHMVVLTLPRFHEDGDEPREQRVVAESPITLHCDVTGTPTPRISWKKNNVPVTSHTAPGVVLSPDKRTLHIATARLHDAGVYQCAATNKVGRRDQEFTVVVIVPPEVDGVREEDIVTVKGSAVVLHCPITGLPDPDITWSKLGVDGVLSESKHVIISTNRKLLELPKTRLKDDGVYSCVGVNPGGVATKLFNVTVLEAAAVDGGDLTEDRRVSEGKLITLVCRVRGRPTPDVVWLHNGRLVDDDNSIASAGNVEMRRGDGGAHELTVSRVRLTDAGKYTCLASNEVGVAEKSYRVKVQVPPRLSRISDDDDDDEPNTIESLEGLPTTIRCPLDARSAAGLDIHWSKDSKPLSAGGDVLHIASARAEHAGNYTCVAQNHAGRVAKTFKLDVLVPPSLTSGTEATSHHKVTSNDVLRLTCNVSGHPEPDIQWYKGVKPLSAVTAMKARLEDLNKTLVIQSIQASHSGQYSCVATNVAGATEMTFDVDVEEPPKMDDQSRSLLVNHTVKLHRRLALQCPMTGSPQPKITWYKDGVSMKSGNNVHVSTDGKQLHLMTASMKTAGEYECVAENHAGKNTIHFNVVVVVPAEWSEWGEWSECSAVCGKGEHVRVRHCQSADKTQDNHFCQGDGEQWRACQMPECQIDGSWSSWSGWTSCSESCGRATRRRYRKCDSPEPEYGGQPCLGSDGQQEYCLQAACPVNGQWSPWTEWSECTASCGQGSKHRTRKCNNPAPAHHGDTCRGLDLEIGACNMNHCPQHGGWSDWAPWSPCSTSCGPGMQRRHRTCSAPPPKFGGGPCYGDNLQLEKCNSRSCDRVPLQASLRVRGKLNGERLDPVDNLISASISELGPKRIVSTSVNDMLKQQHGWFPYVGFMLAPVSWNTAMEMDEANNGYSLTSGNFEQRSQIEFATGEELTLRHIGHGMGDDGALHVDIEVQGDVPIVQSEANVIIEPFQEDYVQTGPNSLFTSAKSFLMVNGKKMPYSWNNTVSYDTLQGTMPYLVERLSTSDIGADYDAASQQLRYSMSTDIRRKYADSDKCPDGFTHNPRHLHCADVDECSDPRTNRCHSTQVCENLFGSYRCYCKPGFASTGVGRRCSDVDECLHGAATCSHQCHNTRGSYKCLCPHGFALQADGSTCLTERAFTGSVPRSLLRQLPPGFHDVQVSKCPPGFHDVRGNCHDTNECRVGLRVCGVEQTCLNTRGSFQCLDTACPQDYLKNTQFGSCMKFCDDVGAFCSDGASISQTLTYSVVEVDSEVAEPQQTLVKLSVREQGGRHVTKTRFRIVENERGKPFRVRLENGDGAVFALRPLVMDRVYKIIVLALSFDDTGKNVLNTTRFVIYIHLSGD